MQSGTDQVTVEYPEGCLHKPMEEVAEEQDFMTLKTDVTAYQLFKVFIPIGLHSYGSPMTQVEYIRQEFVQNLAWISEDVFQELLTICCGIPGSIVCQLAISIGSLVSNSWFGGVVSFLGFTLPAASLMGLIGCLYRILELESLILPCYVKLALHGFASSSVAVVFQAAWKYFVQMQVTFKNFSLICASLVLFILYEQPLFMVALMVCGGFIMQMIEKEDYYRSSLSIISNEEIVVEETHVTHVSKILQEQKGMFGKRSLYAYAFILVLLVFLRISSNSKQIESATSFYYIGSLLMGGGHVGIPLLLTDFTSFGMITKDIFFNGFSINNMLPGTIMSIAVFIGGFADSIRGAFIGYVFLFLPTFLFIWGVLPFWHNHRKDPNIQTFIRGATLVSTGFVFATAYKLWQNAGQDDIITSTLQVIIAFVLLNIYELPTPQVVLIGGTLTIVRYMALHDYRGVEEDLTC